MATLGTYYFDGQSRITPDGISATDDAPVEWKDGIATLDFWVKFDAALEMSQVPIRCFLEMSQVPMQLLMNNCWR